MDRVPMIDESLTNEGVVFSSGSPLYTAEAYGDLARLQELLQTSPDTYWEHAARFLRDSTQAQAISIWLFPISHEHPEVSVRVGEWNEEHLARIQRWEESLRNATPSPDPSETVDGLDRVAGRKAQDRPFFHVRLRADGLLHGGVSLVFSDEGQPAPQHYPALRRWIYLVMDSGIRTRQLMLIRHRLERINFIAQVGQALNSTLDLASVLVETTATAASILDAEAATLFLTDERRGELIFYLPTGQAGGLLKERRIPINQGIAGWVATHRQALVVNDVSQDPRFFKAMDAATGFVTRSILCVPLETPTRLVGVLEVLNKRSGGFTDEDLSWLETLGHQAAIALENARLYESLRQEQERLIRTQEAVRHQIARDLHDGPAQILSLISMNADMARQFLDKQRLKPVRAQLDLLEELANQAKHEIRTLLFELRPVILESKGLVAALRYYQEQLPKTLREGQTVSFELEDLPWEPSPQAANQIFSVIQEAINNARKHAQAAHLWVRLWSDATHLHFQVEDDGPGFDVDKVLGSYGERASFGLMNMYERVEMLDGRLSIQSPNPQTGKGTLVYGRLPWETILPQEDA